MDGRRIPGGRWIAPVLGTFLFLAVFAVVIAVTLPDDFLLSAVRPALGRHGVRIDARETRLQFPAGIRLAGVTVAVAGQPPLPLDEVALSWEWTGLFRWLPARIRFHRGSASGDFRFSPAFWNPSRGTVSLAGVSYADFPLPVFSASGAGLAIRRAEAKWRIAGGTYSADGTASLEHLRIPVPAPESPIRDARIENVELVLTVQGDKLISDADSLLNELELLSEYKATELETLRYRYLYKQLFAVKTKLIILSGSVLPFDLESRALYDVSPPEITEKDLQKVIDELDKILPGKGDVTERITSFKKKFEIPKDKIATVFDAAIKECRNRTSKYINLPAGEKFKTEYVEAKPWGAYNWYKGNLFSLIQIATDFPVYINSPVGLAAHEGYPGHHVYNILLEENLVKDKGWIEYTVYPLLLSAVPHR